MTAPDYRAHLRRRLRETGVPENLQDGLIEYIAARRPTGSFLRAVLCNDLAQAVLRADPQTFLGLRETVLFVYNYAPSPCWGSAAEVEAWLRDPRPAPEIFE